MENLKIDLIDMNLELKISTLAKHKIKDKIQYNFLDSIPCDKLDIGRGVMLLVIKKNKRGVKFDFHHTCSACR